MKRLLAASVLMLTCMIGFAADFDDGPYLGVRFIETRDKKVRITSIDPKALAWQMGLRENDVFVTVSKKKVESREAVQAALKAIQKKDGVEFDIEVERLVSPDEVLDFKVGDLEALGKLMVKESTKTNGAKLNKGQKTILIDLFPDEKDGKKMSESPTKQQAGEPRSITLKGVIRESTFRPGHFYATFSGGRDRPSVEQAAKKDRKEPAIPAKKDR